MWGILILKPSIELVRKTKINVILAKIYPLPLKSQTSKLLTTNLLLPSFVFEDSTLELEFMKKHKFPKFKLPMTYEVFKTLTPRG
jgi:hypothetical protein